MTPFVSAVTEPDRPRNAIRIGVSGHRHLSAEAEMACRRVCAAVLHSCRAAAEDVPSLHLHEMSPWLTLFAAAAPAWGAACHAIEVQGEFERLIVRSHEMQAGLQELLATVDRIGAPPSFEDLFAVAGEIAETMLADVIDWRIVYQLRAPQPI